MEDTLDDGSLQSSRKSLNRNKPDLEEGKTESSDGSKAKD